jgi:hypothetical protein
VAPDYVTILYSVQNDDNGSPDGATFTATYPWPTQPTSQSIVQIFDYRDAPMPAASALAVAQNLYTQLANSKYAGDVNLPPMVKTINGDVLPSWFVRPGDRVDLTDRDDGKLLYVTATAFDWSSLTGTATIGWGGTIGMKGMQWNVGGVKRVRGGQRPGRPGAIIAAGMARRHS